MRTGKDELCNRESASMFRRSPTTFPSACRHTNSSAASFVRMDSYLTITG